MWKVAAQGEGQVQRGPSKITARLSKRQHASAAPDTPQKEKSSCHPHLLSPGEGAEDQEPLKEAATLGPGNGFRSQLPPLLSEPLSSPEKWEYK